MQRGGSDRKSGYLERRAPSRKLSWATARFSLSLPAVWRATRDLSSKGAQWPASCSPSFRLRWGESRSQETHREPLLSSEGDRLKPGAGRGGGKVNGFTITEEAESTGPTD